MRRDIAIRGSHAFEVLVIGGGVHGAAIAYHAAKAGYRIALVEKNDFCSGTSANSLKILHGGLRYLQHLNIKRMRHSITARREMTHRAPYLVEPLACMMPLYGKGLRGRAVMQVALLLNDLIGWDRNKGLPMDTHLPAGHIISKEQCLQVAPGIATENLHGAAVWYDALAANTERLVLEYIFGAMSNGAQAANYAEVTGVDRERDDLYRVRCKDTLNNRTYELRTQCIVNASGPWFEKSLGLAEQTTGVKQQWALALNLVSRTQIFTDYAVALEGSKIYQDKDAVIQRGKRLYFFVPWRGHTMIGTEYEPSVADPDGLKVQRETIENMVREINTIYPQARLRYEDISFFHAGLLPMRSQGEQGDVQLEKNSTFHEHGAQNFKRVLSLKGVKYTTAPHVAAEIVGFLQKQCEPSLGRKREEAEAPVVDKWTADTSKWRGMLEIRYGGRAARILPYIEKEQDREIWIDRDAHLLKAEVRYMIAEEMACTVSDIVFRRSGLGTAEYPGRGLLKQLSAFMGQILGWDAARQEKELEDVRNRYAPLVVPEG